MSKSILTQIGARTRERVELARRRAPLATLTPFPRAPRDFAQALRLRADPGAPAVIAEVKLASPSEGRLVRNGDPVAIATDYLAHGAAALSVLTEPEFFDGRPAYLLAIRKAHPSAALLMKDFVLDEYQLHLARYLGADCVLLILALLGAQRCRELHGYACALGLSVLVEVHDETELDQAFALGATLIGVNNRDLSTLKVSLETSERLAARVEARAAEGPRPLLICESGITAGRQVSRLRGHGYQGFLIGSHFMRSGRPGPALAELLAEARP